jgi:hypothetical protein
MMITVLVVEALSKCTSMTGSTTPARKTAFVLEIVESGAKGVGAVVLLWVCGVRVALTHCT